MPTDPTNGDSTRRGPRGIGRRVIAMALFVFVGLYLLSDIPGEISRWKMAVAYDQHKHKQFEQALQTAIEAQQWDPNNLSVALKRIGWLTQQGEDEAALQSLTDLLEAVEGDRGTEIFLLQNRAEQLQYMDRHQEAIADADKAVEYEKALRRPINDAAANARAMNDRAYTVARAAAAGQASDEQIGNAIAEMKHVMQYLHQQRGRFVSSKLVESRMVYQIAEVGFLDTDAYLRLYAGEEYRSEVLRDFNRCVETFDQLIALTLVLAKDPSRRATMGATVEGLKRQKAVILHHRGEAYALLGNNRAAREDKNNARQLGYGKEYRNW